MSKTKFPRLRMKVNAFYYDTQSKPRVWIPLGSDPVKAMERYRRLITATKRTAIGTVDRMVDDYLAHLKGGGVGPSRKPVTKSTLLMYRAWKAHISDVFGHMDPAEVTHGDVTTYLHRCVRTSGRSEISLLSSAYQHALVGEAISFNPCIGIKAGKQAAERTRLISDDEFARIYAASGPTLQVALDLAYLTGLRISDLLELRWEQFQDDGVVVNKKTQVKQRFPVTEDLKPVLAAARALQAKVGSMYVLCGRGGQPLSYWMLVRRDWKRACVKAGVTGVVWHDLRAKAATDEDAAGGDAQKTLGHSNAQTTKTYLRGKRVVTVQTMRRRKL